MSTDAIVIVVWWRLSIPIKICVVLCCVVLL